MEPLSPADSMVEHFRNRPIGSQISKENPAFAHMEAGTATKLLWRERKKFRKTNKKGELEDVNQWRLGGIAANESWGTPGHVGPGAVCRVLELKPGRESVTLSCGLSRGSRGSGSTGDLKPKASNRQGCGWVVWRGICP